MEKPKFTIIIVGGSISGLTLAHCLARANVDHIILEKRAEIAPQEGAFIGIWPNGARILQQLGIYASLERLTAPLSRMHISFPDGFSFSSLLPKTIHERLYCAHIHTSEDDYSDLVDHRFGYPIISLDRQKVLEVLFQSYPTRSNIMTNKRVTEVRLGADSASVLTDDGDVFEADLIVGADGVHSHIRSEMWRLADTMDPGWISHSEKKGDQHHF
jgi:FAD dependent monooxygenase